MKHPDYYCLTDRELRLGEEISDEGFRRIYGTAPEAIRGGHFSVPGQGAAAGDAGGSARAVEGSGGDACQKRVAQA